MTLPNFGVLLSLNQIHIEAGGTSGTTVSLNESDIRGLISKTVNTSNSISEYYGASSTPPYTQIVSGDGWYYYVTMGQNPSDPTQPNPQNSYMWIIVKLGGNIVKGSLVNNSNVYAIGGDISSVFAGANAQSYTHTDGYTYKAGSQITANNTPTNNFPNQNFPNQLSMYDNFGIQRL